MTALAQDLVDALGLKHSGLILAPVDVVQVVETVVARQRMVRSHRERIEVRVDAAGGTPVVVMGDRARLERAVDNLVSNALKYSPPEELVMVSVQVTGLEGDGRGPTVVVEVSDRGAGVPVEHQESIFTAFTRAPNTAATPGSGLGLAIVKEIAELHRGSVRLDSTEGVGSTFTLDLPLLPDTPEVLDAPPEAGDDRSASVA
jgi:signal transduction histidine kinase